jgi:hypothetical protein
VHGELGQAHAKQQGAGVDVARHLAAHRHRLARLDRGADGRGDQPKHGRMELVIEMRDPVVAAIDGQRVLHEVVGPDREEVEPLCEPAGRQRSGRYLHHATDRHRIAKGDAALAKLLACPVDQDQRRVDLLRMREHREQNPYRAVYCGAQQRA